MGVGGSVPQDSLGGGGLYFPPGALNSQSPPDSSHFFLRGDGTLWGGILEMLIYK